MKKALILSVMMGLGLFAQAKGQAHDPHDEDHWYDLACCSLDDCAPVGFHTMEITSAGVTVYLEPGDHKYVTKPIEKFFPWGDPYLRDSQDGYHHACVYDMGVIPKLPHEITGEDVIPCVYIAMMG